MKLFFGRLGRTIICPAKQIDRLLRNDDGDVMEPLWFYFYNLWGQLSRTISSDTFLNNDRFGCCKYSASWLFMDKVFSFFSRVGASFLRGSASLLEVSPWVIFSTARAICSIFFNPHCAWGSVGFCWVRSLELASSSGSQHTYLGKRALDVVPVCVEMCGDVRLTHFDWPENPLAVAKKGSNYGQFFAVGNGRHYSILGAHVGGQFEAHLSET